MTIIDRFLENFFWHILGALDWLLQHISAWHWPWVSGAAVLCVFSFFVGRRLKTYNHPDLPLASPAIRLFGGEAAYWIGCTAIVLVTSLFALVVVLLLVAGSTKGLLQSWDQWTAISFYFLKSWLWIHDQILGFLGGAVTGSLLSAYMVFRVIPAHERGEGLRDVRHMEKLFKKMKAYSPQNLIDCKKGIFVGLEEGRHPVYVPTQQFHETHTQVIGASGSGKGIALGVLAYQFTLAGEGVIIFDPKGDKRLPLVAALAAEKAGKQFRFIDLRPDAPPQFNLLSGATAHEIEELLIAGLGLQPTSGDGDYYRGIDQDAAASVAHQVVGSEVATIATALDLARKDPDVVKAENFVRRLKQVSELAAIQTSHDFDLEGTIARGDVLYILGATDNHRVKTVQMMLLIEIAP